MAIFGKRTVNESKYIVPPKSWTEPEASVFYERIGVKPNDPENIRVTAEDVARMAEEGRKSLAARVTELQAQLKAKGYPHANLRPFWMIQDNCWTGQPGEFLLYTLRLNPYEKWNTVILPANLDIATRINLPVHPGANVPMFAKAGEEAILGLRRELWAAKAEAERTHEFARFSDIFDKTVSKVKALAVLFAKEIDRTHRASPNGLWFNAL